MSNSPTRTTASKPRGGADLARMRREPTHPGEAFLEEWIKPRGFGAQAAAARAMGMSVNRLNEICAKKRGVTAETAVLIGALTGTSPQMWAHLQADYDVWHAMQTVDVSKIAAIKRPA